MSWRHPLSRWKTGSRLAGPGIGTGLRARLAGGGVRPTACEYLGVSMRGFDVVSAARGIYRHNTHTLTLLAHIDRETIDD